ncbi:MAG: glycosyltransferase family 39 protein, partial [Candidatus Shapirobacteria bacterium]|nr:glycosyltransferase family 39 protein [Candidatus Shapirobacteria bacterium]
AFWLVVFKLNPLGPAIGFGFLSLLSCILLYLTAKNFGFKKAGIFASLLFAVSPLMINYGQTMFNSYFLVSFTIFSFWAISEFWLKKQHAWLFLAGIFAGIAVQANFLSYGFLLAMFIFLAVFKKKFLKNLLYFFGGVFLAILPYLTFEVRHSFFNLKGFLSLATQSELVAKNFNFWLSIPAVFYKTIYYPLGNQNNFLTIILLILSLVFLIFFLCQKKKDDFLKIIFLFWFFTAMGVRFYRGGLLDHYLGVIYPFVFLWFGYLFEKLISFKKRIFFYFCFIVLIIFQLSSFRFKVDNGFGMPSGWNMKATKKAAKIIAEDASGKFNVANLLDGDTRGYAYRYLLSLSGKEPLGVESYPESDILYVITKVSEKEVFSYPVWEIYSFVPTKIEKSWTIKDNVKIFKLVKK